MYLFFIKLGMIFLSLARQTRTIFLIIDLAQILAFIHFFKFPMKIQ